MLRVPTPLAAPGAAAAAPPPRPPPLLLKVPVALASSGLLRGDAWDSKL
jgi:hypothetical protein